MGTGVACAVDGEIRPVMDAAKAAMDDMFALPFGLMNEKPFAIWKQEDAVDDRL